jgi:hypothetical protein
MKSRICSTTVILVIIIVFFLILLGFHFAEVFSLYLKDRMKNVFTPLHMQWYGPILGFGREGMDTTSAAAPTAAPAAPAAAPVTDDLTKQSATNLKPVLAQLEAYIYS